MMMVMKTAAQPTFIELLRCPRNYSKHILYETYHLTSSSTAFWQRYCFLHQRCKSQGSEISNDLPKAMCLHLVVSRFEPSQWDSGARVVSDSPLSPQLPPSLPKCSPYFRCQSSWLWAPMLPDFYRIIHAFPWLKALGLGGRASYPNLSGHINMLKLHVECPALFLKGR